MKNVFLFLLFFQCAECSAQTKPFNCKILEAIINRIDSEKQDVELRKQIENKVEYQSGTLVKKAAYKNDKILDSILKLPNIEDIYDEVIDDSLFYLKDDNIIVDTFRFFTPECSYRFQGKNIIVVNSYNEIPKDKKYNIISVYSLNTYGYYIPEKLKFVKTSCIFLRHKNIKNDKEIWFKKVKFAYDIENNIPVIKSMKVMRHEMG